ncbi:HIRAN domain-containing protein [Metabacillus halosaccharovorans]|uniref:HIRAN domain-containing protein n=1 Tax=Metabacillus halosaccharovorans TaxID=930124 RepID=UPI0034CEFBF2
MTNQSIHCPQCGGSNTKKRYITTLLFLLGLNAFLWIPILGWLIGTVLIILGLIRISKKKKTFLCKECKNLFSVNESNTLVEVSNTEQEYVIPSPAPFRETELNQDTGTDLATNIKSKSNSITFNVAGVTFENDNNKEIQPLLRRIARQIAKDNDIESYAGYTNAEILEYVESVSEFEDLECGDYIRFEKDPNNEFDENAIKVVIDLDGKKHHIGHVPKKENVKIGSLLDSDSDLDISANFVGGKIKEVEYDFEKDKDVVITNELTLGLEITIYINEDQLIGVN